MTIEPGLLQIFARKAFPNKCSEVPILGGSLGLPVKASRCSSFLVASFANATTGRTFHGKSRRAYSVYGSLTRSIFVSITANGSKQGSVYGITKRFIRICKSPVRFYDQMLVALHAEYE